MGGKEASSSGSNPGFLLGNIPTLDPFMNSQCTVIFLTPFFSLQDFVLGPSRGVSYGVGMPTELLHHQAGSTMSRLAYGQSPVGLYAQNQPLPAGRCAGKGCVLHLCGNLLQEPLCLRRSYVWSQVPLLPALFPDVLSSRSEAPRLINST